MIESVWPLVYISVCRVHEAVAEVNYGELPLAQGGTFEGDPKICDNVYGDSDTGRVFFR
jgi:hypothetical protein